MYVCINHLVFDLTGKLILESKSRLATAPDGNGGIYTAMLNKGVLKAMEKRGVKYIHAFSIDNALVQVADPIYVGYCIANNADVGNKCCPKARYVRMYRRRLLARSLAQPGLALHLASAFAFVGRGAVSLAHLQTRTY
jgi:hypothetical protein